VKGCAGHVDQDGDVCGATHEKPAPPTLPPSALEGVQGP
jgi:hypothetical protein